MVDCTLNDPASDIITKTIAALRDMFDPGLECPPIGGGWETGDSAGAVMFVPGEGPGWDPIATQSADGGCDTPFLWVRLVTRFRTVSFPEHTPMTPPCGGVQCIVLELGVGRCVDMSPEADWATAATEAEIAVDDSWRLDRAMCLAAGRIKNGIFAFDPVNPLGPEGGGLILSTALYVGITS